MSMWYEGKKLYLDKEGKLYYERYEPNGLMLGSACYGCNVSRADLTCEQYYIKDETKVEFDFSWDREELEEERRYIMEMEKE